MAFKTYLASVVLLKLSTEYWHMFLRWNKSPWIRGGERERDVSFPWMWPEPELSHWLSLNYYNKNTVDWVVCACTCMLMGPCGLLPARLLCPWNSPARLLEWVAISSSRISSQPRDQTRIVFVSWIGRFFTTKPPGMPHRWLVNNRNSSLTFLKFEMSKIKAQGNSVSNEAEFPGS